MNSSTLHEKILKGSVIAIFFSLLGSILAYLIKVMYSRTLSVEHYGIFYAVFGFFILISTYTELGFGEAMSYFIPKHLKNEKYKDLLNTLLYGQTIQVVVAVLFAIIVAILAPTLATYYFKVAGSVYLIYIFCVFLILVSLLNSLLQIFTGLQKEKYYSSIYILRNGLTFSLSILFLVFGLNTIYFYGVAWIIGYFITSLVFLYLLWSNHSFLNRRDLVWNKGIFQAMYKYALPAFSTTFIYTLITSSDVFFLTLLRDVREVAVYSVVVPIASISLVFLLPLNNVLLPLISHLMEGEKEKLGFLIGKIYQIVPFIGVYFALFIILFPSSTVGLIFGDKWLGLAQAPLSYLSLGYIALLMSNILGIITLGTGKVQERLKILLIMAIFNIALHTILVYKFGILGAIITNSLTAIVLCLLFTRILQAITSFQIPYFFYTKIILVSVGVFVAIRFIGYSPQTWFEFIGSGIIYSGFFGFLGYLLGIYDKKLFVLFFPKFVK